MAKSEEPITIKKYANRRLYNTGTSTYVTLEDLATIRGNAFALAENDDAGRAKPASLNVVN